MYSFFFNTFIVLFSLVCLFLILLVLIQKGRGGGLASAFGGGGGNTAFGSKTGDVLTWTTSVVFGIFLLLAVVLNLMANSRSTPTVASGRPERNMPIPNDNTGADAGPSLPGGLGGGLPAAPTTRP